MSAFERLSVQIKIDQAINKASQARTEQDLQAFVRKAQAMLDKIKVNPDKFGLDSAQAKVFAGAFEKQMNSVISGVQSRLEKAFTFKQKMSKSMFGDPDVDFEIGSIKPSELKNLKDLISYESAEDVGIAIADQIEQDRGKIAGELNKLGEEMGKRLGIEFRDSLTDFAIDEEIAQDFISGNGRNKIPKNLQDFTPSEGGKILVSPLMALAAEIDVLNSKLGGAEYSIGGYVDPMNKKPKLDGARPVRKMFEGNQASFAGTKKGDATIKAWQDFLNEALSSEDADRVSSIVADRLRDKLFAILEKSLPRQEFVSNTDPDDVLQGWEEKEGWGSDMADALKGYAFDSIKQKVFENEAAAGLVPGTAASGAYTHLLRGDPRADTQNKFLENISGPVIMPELGNFVANYANEIPELFEQVFNNPKILSSTQKGVYELIKEIKDEVSGKPKEKTEEDAAAGSEEKPEETAKSEVLNRFLEGLKKLNLDKIEQAQTATTADGAMPETDDQFQQRVREYFKQQIAEFEKAGRQFIVSFDTEFNSELQQGITEASLGFIDAGGKLRSAIDFVHAPVEDEAEAMLRGAKNASIGKSAKDFTMAKDRKDLEKRAQEIGGVFGGVGDPSNLEINRAQFQEKIQRLVRILEVVEELNIPIAGSRIKNAEGTSLNKAIEYLNKTNGSKLDFNLKTRGNLLDTSVIAAKKENTKFTKLREPADNKQKFETSLSSLFKNLPGNIGKEMADFLRPLLSQFDNSGNLVSPDSGKKLPAHYARADVAMGLAVAQGMFSIDPNKLPISTRMPNQNQLPIDVEPATPASEIGENAPLTKEISELNDNLNGIEQLATVLKAKAEAEGEGTPPGGGGRKPPTGGGGDGYIPPEWPNGPESGPWKDEILKKQEIAEITRGLTELEKELFKARWKLVKGTADYQDLMAEIAKLEKPRLAREKELAELQSQPRTQENLKQLQLLKAALTEVTSQQEELRLKAVGIAKETKAAVVGQVSQSQMSENLTQNLRNQIDAQIESGQAGKKANEQIVAGVRERVQAEKDLEKAVKESEAAQQKVINQMITGRYALYDVANAYERVGQSMLMVARRLFDLTNIFRSYETAFTSVERALQPVASAEGLQGMTEEARSLKDEFVELSTVIPVAFEDLAQIATLGAQMGIEAGGIVQFTETVAKFSSITGISTEQVAQSFGRIAELADVATSEFENMGSAIAYAGINAVATEQEILTLAESIAAASNQAGFLPDEIIALSTSLASVGVRAEQARGVFTRVFADIDRAADTGGETLQGFANLAGMSADEFQQAWGTQGASYDVFEAILQGIGAAENLTQAFDSINIVETREINTLTRLAANLNVVYRAMEDANESYEQGIFLNEAFEKTADNLDSQVQILKNTFNSVIEELSGGFSTTLKAINEALIGMKDTFLEISKTPLGQFILPAATAFTVLGGSFAMVGSVAAKLLAQLFAFRVALLNLGKSQSSLAIISNIKELIKLFTGKTTALQTNTAAYTLQQKAQDKATLAAQGATSQAGKEAAARLTVAAAAEKEAAALQKGSTLKAAAPRLLGLATSVAGLGLLAVSLGTVIQGIVKAQEEASKIDLLESGGGLASLRDAIKQDTQAFEELGAEASGTLGTVQRSMSKYTTEANTNAQQIAKLTGLTKDYADANKIAKDSIEDVTIALGKNTQEFFANALMQDENYKELVEKYPDLFSDLKDMGIDASSAFASILSDPDTGGEDVISATEKKIASLEEQIRSFASETDSALTFDEDGNYALSNSVKSIQELEAEQEKLEGFLQLLNSIRGAISTAVGENVLFREINELLGVDEVASALMDLQEEYANAYVASLQSGEDMTEIMEQVKAAMLEVANVDDPDFKVDVNAAETIADLQAILKAQLEVEKAMGTEITPFSGNDQLTNDLFGETAGFYQTGPFADGYKFFEPVNQDAIDSLESAITQLGALEAAAIASAEGIEQTTGAVETLEDRLNRLITTSTKMITTTLGLRGAIRQLAAGLETNMSWSNMTEEGSANLEALAGIIEQIGARAAGDFGRAADELSVLKVALIDSGLTAENAAGAFSLINNALTAIGASTELTVEQMEALRGTLAYDEIFGSFQIGQAEVDPLFKTINDYASGIKTMLDDAFSYRYGMEEALEGVNDAWEKITSSAEEAREAIEEADRSIQSLNADRGILEYQLSVAERYGDTVRAAQLRAELEELDAEILDQEEARAEAEDEISTSLDASTKAGAKNRRELRGIIQEYNSYMASLARTGMSTADMQGEAAGLVEEFYSQGEALGFTREQLDEFAVAFQRDFDTISNEMDQFRGDIELNVSTDPALRAVSEFVLDFNEEMAKAIADRTISISFDVDELQIPEIDIDIPGGNTGGGSDDTGGGSDDTGGGSTRTVNPAYTAIQNTLKAAQENLQKASGSVSYWTKQVDKWQAEMDTPGLPPYAYAAINDKLADATYFLNKNKALKAGYLDEVDRLLRQLSSTPQYLAKGGFAKGTDTVPAMLTPGEFIMSRGAVQKYGAGFMNALNQQSFGFSPATSSRRNSQQQPVMVYLSPEDRRLLRDAADREIALYTDNATIAKSANDGNQLLAQRGLR